MIDHSNQALFQSRITDASVNDVFFVMGAYATGSLTCASSSSISYNRCLICCLNKSREAVHFANVRATIFSNQQVTVGLYSL